MFRIDLENGDDNQVGAVFHLTLGTEKLKCGRKGDSLDVVFSNDKSCSRSHCEVAVARLSELKASGREYCLSAEHSSQFQASNLPSTQASSKPMLSYFSQSVNPSMTPTQTQNHDGTTPLPSFQLDNINPDVVITITDLGSKFGTFVGEEKHRLPNETPTILKLGAMGSGIVQVGAQNSKLRITRIPLVLCFSAVSDKSLLEDPKKADTIGAICGRTWSCRSSTHLVTDARKNTGKNIMAWATSRPVITTKWVEALMARTRGSDPIPDEFDYEPSGTLKLDRVDQSLPRNNTLENVYLLSLMKEELEELAIAGGGKVKRCYEMSDKEFFEDKGAWLKTLIVANLSPGVKKNSVVLLEPRGGKEVDAEITKRRNHLIETFGIPVTGQTQLANSVSTLEGLQNDSEDKDLTKTIWAGRKVAKNRKKGAKAPILSQSQYLNDSPGSSSEEGLKDAVGGSGKNAGTKGAGGGGENSDSDATDDEGLELVPPPPPQPFSPNSPATKTTEVGKKRKKEGTMEPSPMISKKKVKRGGKKDTPHMETVFDNEGGNDDREEEEEEEDDGDPPPTPLPEPKSKLSDLVGKAGGWLKIAPPSRADYKRPLGALADDMAPITEVVPASVLVVRTMEESRKAREGKGKKKTKKRGYNGPDYRRFRKNKICSRYEKVTLMRAVLPKESERELVLMNTQREIEKRQEEAERLFGGGGGGTMEEYLSTGTQQSRRRRR
ncbi:hypothetical protein TrCOL_g743 [Triparma columacea]|uniref:FHA domain-containing protein n=1 Tax=Triparma columacea TaxID=722753 RepID=A0A9W7G2Z8_9STRA|nr:hypothetical protein TrCOL_g743 [Triparma columacea]